MTTDDELDLVETERLLKAVQRRFDCTLIATLKDMTSAQEERGFTFSGGFVTAMGLAEFTRQRLIAQMHTDAENRSEDE